MLGIKWHVLREEMEILVDIPFQISDFRNILVLNFFANGTVKMLLMYYVK